MNDEISRDVKPDSPSDKHLKSILKKSSLYDFDYKKSRKYSGDKSSISETDVKLLNKYTINTTVKKEKIQKEKER